MYQSKHVFTLITEFPLINTLLCTIKVIWVIYLYILIDSVNTAAHIFRSIRKGRGTNRLLPDNDVHRPLSTAVGDGCPVATHWDEPTCWDVRLYTSGANVQQHLPLPHDMVRHSCLKTITDAVIVVRNVLQMCLFLKRKKESWNILKLHPYTKYLLLQLRITGHVCAHIFNS